MELVNKKLIACMGLFISIPSFATELFITGGPTFSEQHNSRYVNLNTIVTNAYQTNTTTSWGGIGGLGVRRLLTSSKNDTYGLLVGLSGYFMDLGRTQGTEFPFANLGVFDTLDYNFRGRNASVLLEPRLVYRATSWQPVLQLGIGMAWNQLSHYSEVPTNPSLSAAPIIPAFKNNTQTQLAYELGVGVQRQLLADKIHNYTVNTEIGYRYFNLGSAKLGPFPAQTTNDSLKIKHFQTQAILVSLILSLH